MSVRARSQASKIDRLMEDASSALSQMRLGECERAAHEALHLAHQSGEYDRMARILMPLQEARRLRRQQAADTKKIVRVDDYAVLEPLLTGTKPIRSGCYLFEPPLVGADGREFRERSLAENASVSILVREPATRLGQWPIVAIGPTTIRARIPTPKKVDLVWFQAAGESLGDAALALVDPQEEPEGRVDHILDLLDTVVDHEKLHQALETACREAAHQAAINPKKSRARSKHQTDDELDEEPEAEA